MKKNFARYVSLNVLGTLALSCYILADTYFVSQWLGTAGLAALNIAIPPYSILFGIGMMLGMGGGARYALQKATGETEMGNQTFTQTLLMGGVFALVFMLTGALFPGQLSTLLGADVETYAMTKIYLRVLLLCAPFFICNQILIA
ncbi:MAG: MATE family efflux transporter, partial [Oscillospiraceae bacterium]|nr:MATE family efflux transporter [Oscillospiraceae bacterium]